MRDAGLRELAEAHEPTLKELRADRADAHGLAVARSVVACRYR